MNSLMLGEGNVSVTFRKTEILKRIPPQDVRHQTSMGAFIEGDSLSLLKMADYAFLAGKVDLILTSPPFPLNKKKSYGNLTGDAYLDWFRSLAPLFDHLLTDTGSVVIEIGNSWEPERPVQSLLHLEALLSLVKHPDADLRLIQQFVNYNPARLPSPAQWVTVNRIRVVDSFTHIWWLAKTDTPKADNRKVLRPYSRSMKKLLRTGRFNADTRPSAHRISPEAFLKNNGGAIAHNLFENEPIDPERPPRLPNVFSLANTISNDHYHRSCKSQGIRPHPARMHPGVAAFFIQFLTDPGDLVLDPFAGSNTTGFMAECLKRPWLAIDVNPDYAEHSRLRFSQLSKHQETAP